MTLRNGYLCEERAGRLCFGSPALILQRNTVEL